MRIAEEIVKQTGHRRRSGALPIDQVSRAVTLRYLLLRHALFGVHWRQSVVRRAAQKTATYRDLRFFQLAAIVPIGRHNLKYRRWFVSSMPWASELRISVRQRLDALAIGPINRSIERNAACRFSSVTTMSTKP